MDTATFFQSPLIISLGVIATIVVGVSLVDYLVCGPSRTHRVGAHSTTRTDCRPVMFTAHNVQVDHCYEILVHDPSGGKSTLIQEFRVQDRRMDYFLISVRTRGRPCANQLRTFEGWTDRIRGDRFIRPEDLLAVCPT